MMTERAMNFATIWYGIVNDLRFASNAREQNVYSEVYETFKKR